MIIGLFGSGDNDRVVSAQMFQCGLGQPERSVDVCFDCRVEAFRSDVRDAAGLLLARSVAHYNIHSAELRDHVDEELAAERLLA